MVNHNTKCNGKKKNRHDSINYLKFCNDGGRYHIETSPLIFRTNQWTGFYMISASVMKDLKILSLNALETVGLNQLRHCLETAWR